MSSTVMTASAKASKWLHAAELVECLRRGAILPDVVTMGAIMESLTFADHAWQRSIFMLLLEHAKKK